MRSAAWDLLLLRLPAHLLGTSGLNEVTVGYVCTGDAGLHRLAKVCNTEAVVALEPHTRKPFPVMSYDLSALQQMIGSKAVADITERDSEWQKSRAPCLSETGERISYDDLLTLTANLEAEVAQFCRS